MSSASLSREITAVCTYPQNVAAVDAVFSLLFGFKGNSFIQGSFLSVSPRCAPPRPGRRSKIPPCFFLFSVTRWGDHPSQGPMAHGTFIFGEGLVTPNESIERLRLYLRLYELFYYVLSMPSRS
jgi:hypothetical protein